jgi:hypothetical protein
MFAPCVLRIAANAISLTLDVPLILAFALRPAFARLVHYAVALGIDPAADQQGEPQGRRTQHADRYYGH